MNKKIIALIFSINILISLLFIQYKTNSINNYLKNTISFSVSQGMIQSQLYFFNELLKEINICSFKLNFQNINLRKKTFCKSTVFSNSINIGKDYTASYTVNPYEFIPNLLALNIALVIFYYLIFVLIRTKRINTLRDILESHMGEIMKLSLDKNDSVLNELEGIKKDNTYTDYSLSILKTKIMKVIGQNNDFKRYIHDSSSPMSIFENSKAFTDKELRDEAIERLIDLNLNLKMSSYKNQTSILDIRSQIKSVLSLFKMNAVLEKSSEKPFFITASRISIFKIFSNLLKNSQARMGKKGKVTIKIIEESESIILIYKCIDASGDFLKTIDNVDNREHQGLGGQIIHDNIKFLKGDITYDVQKNIFQAKMTFPLASVKISQIDITTSAVKISDEIPLSMFNKERGLTIQGTNCSYEVHI